ncbi:ABC transporter ATP-binding protein [Pigmentiphaga aceris]|uniref:ABC transporter ATP-binding protein n=1 Tax=Pigmentiphaga aceris TaxID=1940612 RepID=A0A5C0AY71_9BURK|nr:ABC transporter ATP-binding protein [Pigmentiphaga aceris]QEI05780.1 ABC transporter ATP-binding protein [Pigmentiphaga aceris]
MLKLEGVAAGYGTSQVLFGMDFTIGQGEVISLIGRNGMGKTTTVRTLMGMLPARSGSISLLGKPITNLPPYRIARMGVGLVPEGRRAFASLNVEENLVATARLAGAKSNPWTVDRVYSLFPRLQERRKQSARTLSGGEQQMLVVGRALLTNPQLLVLDEATEGLAPLIRQEIWQCLRVLRDSGLSILLIDKNLAEMTTLVQRHHIVEKGRVVWVGSPDELNGDPALRDRYLGI